MPARRKQLIATSNKYDTGSQSRKNERRCVATGAALLADSPAIRFVVSPEGSLLPDLAGKLPGRGAWVEADQASLRKALQQNQFAQSFKKQITPSLSEQEMVEMVRSGLYKRALNALGIVRRVGKLSSGFEKVKAGLKASKFMAYIHAKDGAADSVDRLRSIAMADDARTVKILGEFTGIDLDQALGMDNVVHLGLLPSGPANVFIKEVTRLSGFLETADA